MPVEDRKYESEGASAVLPPPQGYKRAVEATRCSGTHCKAMIQSCQKFCPDCATPNAAYSSIADAVSKGGRAQGFKRKADPLVDMEHALDFSPSRKRSLTKVWGDLVSKVRGSEASAAAPPAATGTAPAPVPTPAPVAAAASGPEAEAGSPRPSSTSTTRRLACATCRCGGRVTRASCRRWSTTSPVRRPRLQRQSLCQPLYKRSSSSRAS